MTWALYFSTIAFMTCIISSQGLMPRSLAMLAVVIALFVCACELLFAPQRGKAK